jgi:general secretion pathway protein I
VRAAPSHTGIRLFGGRLRAGGGFTLLEVLVALAVLGIAFVGLLGLHNRSLRLATREQTLTWATLLAQDLMTRTQIEGLAASAARPSGDFSRTHPQADPQFRWQREILPTAMDGLWEIRIRVLRGDRPECELTYVAPLGS